MIDIILLATQTALLLEEGEHACIHCAFVLPPGSLPSAGSFCCSRPALLVRPRLSRWGRCSSPHTAQSMSLQRPGPLMAPIWCWENADGSMQVRDGSTGKILVTLHGHRGHVWAVAWS